MNRLLLLVLVAAALPAGAQSMEEAAGRIASRISKTLAASTAVRFAVENRSSLPAQVVDQLRAILGREFKSQADGAELKITVSENSAGPMIVAELPAGAVLIERFTAPAPKQLRYPARLQMRPVRTQPAAILDFAMVQDMLAVLEPSRIAMYAKDQQSSVSIAPAAPMPRDPRGRLLAREATLEAYLPGTTCVVQMQTPPAIACRPGTTSWREGQVSVSWAPRRNYLVVNEGEKSADGFGSDMAPITNACSAGAALIVASSAGDADVVQAVAGLQPLTERVAVPGPVVALWTAETDKEVSLVVRNNRTGEYEASRVSLVCDR